MKTVRCMQLALAFSGAVGIVWLTQVQPLREQVSLLEAQVTRLTLLAQAPRLTVPVASCASKALGDRMACKHDLPLLVKSGNSSSVGDPRENVIKEGAHSTLKNTAVNDSELDLRSRRLVAKKYRLLIQALGLDPQSEEQLIALLDEREALLSQAVQDYYASPAQIEAMVNSQQRALVALDARILEWLEDDVHQDKYALLKDSDLAQYQLGQLSGGFEGSNALTSDQKSALLLSKLAYQREFEQALTRAGIGSRVNQLSQDDAMSRLREALDTFKSGYYAEAANIMESDQFARFQAFEGAQFEALFESLQRQVALMPANP